MAKMSSAGFGYTFTLHGLLYVSQTAPYQLSSLVLGANQVALGQASGDPVATDIRSAIEATVDQTSSSVTMVAFTQYIINNGSSQVTLTLPATAALGDRFKIVGKSSGGWKIQCASGQTIEWCGVISATAGTCTSLISTASIEIVCVTANTGFEIRVGSGLVDIV